MRAGSPGAACSRTKLMTTARQTVGRIVSSWRPRYRPMPTFPSRLLNEVAAVLAGLALRFRVVEAREAVLVRPDEVDARQRDDRNVDGKLLLDREILLGPRRGLEDTGALLKQPVDIGVAVVPEVDA